jgi:hypothetical protein
MILSVIISIITLWYTHLLSNKSKFGLYMGLFCQLLWTIYIVLDVKDYGLLVLNGGLYIVLINGLRKWEKP